jgi:hypothetical protein
MPHPLLASETTPEERVAFRRDVMEFRLQHSLSETIARFNVSRTFLCKWQKRYRTDPSNLAERSREPKKSANSYTEEEKDKLEISLLIDNQANRKRNKLIPTIFRLSVMLASRSYASIRRMANKLIGKSRRTKDTKTKKIRTGRCNLKPCFPGELVQVDMKRVPAAAVVQNLASEEVRKDDLLFSARRHMEDMMHKLTEQERLFPDLRMIRYLKDECQCEYRQNDEDIRRADLAPQKDLKLYQYTAVDVKSRWAFRWMFAEHSELASLRFAMELVRAAPFEIRCIQTDNGSEFVSDYMAGHEEHTTHFQEFLSSNGILHKRIAGGKPWENAHVEAQHRIDQERLYDTMCVGSLDEAMAVLAEYQRVSNQYPKPCLGMKSPMQMIEGIA